MLWCQTGMDRIPPCCPLTVPGQRFDSSASRRRRSCRYLGLNRLVPGILPARHW